jgi:dTDP-4-dehydrorhamnose reductase
VRIAVLGAAGQLGRDLCPRLPVEVLPLTRTEVDLTHRETLDHLRSLRPDVVINCAAYNLVDRAESEPAAAFAVNAWGVRDLAQVCRDHDCLLVHFSTDYVFGLYSQHQKPYRETDAPGPISVYGLSKLSGEYLVRSICPRHLVIRTSGLYGLWGAGGKGGNFVETMLHLAGQGRPLRVVNDQVCTPTFTQDLAEAVVRLVTPQCEGLFHLTNGGACTWHEFAQAIFAEISLAIDVEPITSAQFGAAARRPAYSVLGTEHDHAVLGIGFRPWRSALGDYLRQRGQKANTV